MLATPPSRMRLPPYFQIETPVTSRAVNRALTIPPSDPSIAGSSPVTIAVRPRSSIRFRGRSFMALVLAPVPPVKDWLAELDTLRARSPGFFGGRAIIVDVSGLNLSKLELTNLIGDLHGRDIRIMGIEGADPSTLGLGLPPPVSGGKTIGFIDTPGEATRRARPSRSAAGLLADDRGLRSLGPVDPSSGRRRHGPGLRRVRRRDHRRRLGPHLRRAPRPGHRRIHRAYAAPGSSAASSRRSCWPSTASTRRPTTSIRASAAKRFRSP